MSTAKPTLLIAVPVKWAQNWAVPLAEIAPDLRVLATGRDEYAPADIDYVLSFRPQPGLLKSLPNLKFVFSIGAGVDGFFADPDYPKDVPLIRFVDRTLSVEMAQYIVMHTLIHYRQQRVFDAQQQAKKWRQTYIVRPARETRIGILGLGEIGTMAAERLHDLDFDMAGWSRTRKNVQGVASYAGAAELSAFLARSDILVCVLPLTDETRHILNAKNFAQLPREAFVINVARGGHLVEADLIAAIDSGHLSGAALDVFETEPLPESSPLWTHPKITVTPHIAAISHPHIAAQQVIEAIAKDRAGEPLDNLVDIERGY
jgi:glyoxylate/hydroxypyruvate reductase A